MVWIKEDGTIGCRDDERCHLILTCRQTSRSANGQPTSIYTLISFSKRDCFVVAPFLTNWLYTLSKRTFQIYGSDQSTGLRDSTPEWQTSPPNDFIRRCRGSDRNLSSCTRFALRTWNRGVASLHSPYWEVRRTPCGRKAALDSTTPRYKMHKQVQCEKEGINHLQANASHWDV